MRVRVTSVLEADRRLVQCDSACGPLQVIWHAPDLPSTGDHDVELDVPATLTWGAEIWRAADGRRDGIGRRDGVGRPILTGTLADLDELGLATVELREGLLVVETRGDPPLGLVGEVIELHPPAITAHPYEL